MMGWKQPVKGEHKSYLDNKFHNYLLFFNRVDYKIVNLIAIILNIPSSGRAGTLVEKWHKIEHVLFGQNIHEATGAPTNRLGY